MLGRSWYHTLVWWSVSFSLALCGQLAGVTEHWSLSWWLGTAWALVVFAGLLVLRWRGLVLLIGAPFALHYPYFMYVIYATCAQNIQMCP
jgi:hypothetical protein